MCRDEDVSKVTAEMGAGCWDSNPGSWPTQQRGHRASGTVGPAFTEDPGPL